MIFNESRHNAHWPVRTLSDLGTFARGKSKHRPRNDKRLFEGGAIPLIQTGEIREAGLYVQKHTETYNEFGLRQSKLWPAGTLCITIAANIAETALLGYPMCFPDSVVGFNADPELSSEVYLHYVFTYIRETIQKATSGSIQDNINIDFLTALKFRIPPKSAQDKIVEVLSTLDAKIELNQRMNEELEGIAKLLYDYWFVQFDFPMNAAQAAALGKPQLTGHPYRTSGGRMVYNEYLKRNVPEGWNLNKLGEIVESISTGLNPRKHFTLGSGSNFYVTIKSIEHGKLLLDSKCDRIDDSALSRIEQRSNLRPGDILFTSIEPVGRLYLIQETPRNWNINESLFSIRPNREKVNSSYLYYLLSSHDCKGYCKKVSTGSIHQGIRIAALRDYTFALPEKQLLETYSIICEPLLKQVHTLNKQNEELTQLRDWLLPMLMNGQVSVG